MTEPTLRELCERVIEALSKRDLPADGTPTHWDALHSASRALGEQLRVGEDRVNKSFSNIFAPTTISVRKDLVHMAQAILDALDAAEAPVYARAMAEVVARCEATSTEYAMSRHFDDHACGICCETEDTADWARGKLAAAAQKGRGE